MTTENDQPGKIPEAVQKIEQAVEDGLAAQEAALEAQLKAVSNALSPMPGETEEQWRESMSKLQEAINRQARNQGSKQ